MSDLRQLVATILIWTGVCLILLGGARYFLEMP